MDGTCHVKSLDEPNDGSETLGTWNEKSSKPSLWGFVVGAPVMVWTGFCVSPVSFGEGDIGLSFKKLARPIARNTAAAAAQDARTGRNVGRRLVRSGTFFHAVPGWRSASIRCRRAFNPFRSSASFAGAGS